MLLSFWLLPIYKSCQRRRHISTTLDDVVLPTYLVSIVLCFIFLIFLVCVILFFMHYQDLSFLETFYMVFMTITTIGYGDYIPNYYTHVPVFIFFWFICSIPFAIFVALLTEINDLMATVWRKPCCIFQEIKKIQFICIKLKKTLHHQSQGHWYFTLINNSCFLQKR